MSVLADIHLSFSHSNDVNIEFHLLTLLFVDECAVIKTLALESVYAVVGWPAILS